ncbi:MAG: acyltransferase [Butyrivibrio sp.]|nr:acyltransferase [Acetatifactor muris]MCM1558961.1 acyltransferase [Butyrivibrio sp.]
METVEKRGRIAWIDALKLLAIFAVFVNHTHMILYTSLNICYLSFFSVTLFVLLSGINSYASYERREKSGEKILWRNCEGPKLKKVIFPYVIATGCYLLFENGVLDLRSFILSVLQFEAAAPFYFVLFYIQLAAASRPLYYLIKATSKLNRPIIYYILEFIGSILVSALLMKYTYILPVYGGGQYLFGGTYLAVYFFGMLIGRYRSEIKFGKISGIISGFVFLGLLAGWSSFYIRDKFTLDVKIKYFGNWNPPGVSLFLLAILILGLGISVDAVIRIYNVKFLIFLEDKVSVLGKYSYYIFLFHLLIISTLRTSRLGELVSCNIWLQRFVYVIITFGISIALGFLMEKLMAWLKRIRAKSS